MKKTIYSIIALLAVVGASYLLSPKGSAVASVDFGSQYQSTTTNSLAASTTLAVGSGTFGSLIVTGASAGAVSVYDGTNTAYSNRLIASFPASLAAGTYTFDAQYSKGLLVTVTGTAPTSTMTFR